MLTGQAIGELTASVTSRWHEIDPLLPAAGLGDAPHCGAQLVVTGSDGSAVAAGSCEHWAGEPDSLDLTWGAARRFQLRPQIPGPDVGGALDRLLALWREHLRQVPGVDAEDTAAVVNWPSRDAGGVQALIKHGLVPLSVIAARPVAGPAILAEVAGLLVRRAGPADIEEVVRLGHGTVGYDSHFGGVIDRPSTAAALREDLGTLLAADRPWIWLAERDGTAIGVLAAEPPEVAGWIASMVGPQPAAYTSLAFVQPGQRTRGIGAALTSHVHAEAAAAGCAVTLLYYEQTNPLSVPFWNQQGYRPVWTSWEARPAGLLR